MTSTTSMASTTPKRIALAIAFSAATLGAAPAVRADAAAASALFDEGKALFAAGRYREARDKLQASYELSPLSGTAGLLAASHERTGQLASAWARYRDAAVLAERTGNQERAAIARAKVAELEPRLAYLQIDPPRGLAAGVVVTRNGQRIPDAALAVSVPVDAGRQVVVATAPGRVRWTRTIEVADGERLIVAVPPLEVAPAAAVDVEVAAPSARPAARGRPAQAWIGLALAGAGGAALVAGGGLGISAAGRWNDAKDAGCTDGGACPDRSSRELARSAGRRADVATVLVGGGLAMAATGLVLFWFAPDADEERPPAGVSAVLDGDRFSLALEGRF